MNPLLPLLTCFCLAALALGKEGHLTAVAGRAPSRLALGAFRWAGGMTLTASAVLAVWTQGASVGLVALTAWLAFDGFALTLLLTYAPRAFPLGSAGVALLPAAGILLARF